MLFVTRALAAVPDPELAWLSDAPLAHSEAHSAARPPPENSTLGNLVQSALQRARNHSHTLPHAAASHATWTQSDTAHAHRTQRHHHHRSVGSLDPYPEQRWATSVDAHPRQWNDARVARQLLPAPGFMTQQRAALPPDPLHQLRQLLLRDPLLPIKVTAHPRPSKSARLLDACCPPLSQMVHAWVMRNQRPSSTPSQPNQVGINPSGAQVPTPKRTVTLHFYRQKGASAFRLIGACPWPCVHSPSNPCDCAGSGKWLADPRGDDSPTPSKALPQLGAGVAGGATSSTANQAYSSPFDAALHGYRGEPSVQQ